MPLRPDIRARRPSTSLGTVLSRVPGRTTRCPPFLDFARNRPELRRKPSLAGYASVVAVLLIPAPAAAQTPARPPHVRPQSRDAQHFVEEAVAASPTVRELMARLDESDVIAYLRFRVFAEIGFEGRLRFLTASGGQRFVVIELACVRTRVDQITTFGHELHHALEIAAAPSIVSVPTLAAYYERIGTETGGVPGGRTFETRSARVTAAIVRKEVFTTPERRTDGQ